MACYIMVYIEKEKCEVEATLVPGHCTTSCGLTPIINDSDATDRPTDTSHDERSR